MRFPAQTSGEVECRAGLALFLSAPAVDIAFAPYGY
nr:MAG TPA: hypothetical protein [Caudoviricetes sp.]